MRLPGSSPSGEPAPFIRVAWIAHDVARANHRTRLTHPSNPASARRTALGTPACARRTAPRVRVDVPPGEILFARAERLDGVTQVGSPAEPQTLSMVFASACDELVTLSVRSWPRDDVDREVERILASFEIIGP